MMKPDPTHNSGSNSPGMTGETVLHFAAGSRFNDGFLRPIAALATSSLRNRELIFLLVRQDLLAVNRKSIVGLAWIFIMPLVGILSWILLNHVSILRPGDVGIPYPAYVLAGTTMWGLFTGCIGAASATLSSTRHLLSYTHFPHEILVVVQLIVKAVYFGIALLVTLVVLSIFGVVPSWGILLFPAVVLPLVLLAAAIGLLIALISVVSSDIDRLIMGGVGLLLYITPVIYTAETIPLGWIHLVVSCNPLTYLICSSRDMLLFGRLYSPTGYCFSMVFALLLFIWVWRLFWLQERALIARVI
jgi:lipopolysaccharide transport system permease protein